MTRDPWTYKWESGEPTCAAGYLIPAVTSVLNERSIRGRKDSDVGCGNGFTAAKLAAQGFSVVGINPGPSGIAIARRSSPESRFEVIEPHEKMLAELGEDPFDIVISTEVIEHVYDAKRFASSCSSALCGGGALVCSTPYHGYLKNLALAIFDRFNSHCNPLQAGGHIKFWSKRTLGHLLVDVGFVNVRFRCAGRIPSLWKSLVAVAERPLAIQATPPADA